MAQINVERCRVHVWHSEGEMEDIKNGVRLHGVDAVDSDSVWFTCCALHNWLLELDGLTDKWVGGVRKVVSGSEGDLGSLDFKGVPVEVPNALARLSASLDPRNYDLSGLGPGSDVMAENYSLLTSDVVELSDFVIRIDDRNSMLSIADGVDRVRRVQYLSLNVFRHLLVNHFAILISQNKIVWPERNTRKRILLTS